VIRRAAIFVTLAGASLFALQNFHASVRDSVKIPSSTLFSGPAGGAEVIRLRPDCFAERRGECFLFQANDTGSYTLIFRSRSTGSLESDTAKILVTDQLPELTLDNRYVSLDMGQPLDYNLTVRDDGDSVKIGVDFDGDGKTDTVALGPGHPLFRFNRPTCSGEKERAFTSHFTVVDNDGHALRDTAALRVYFNPPTAKAGDNIIGCVNETVLFSAKKSVSPIGRVVKYYWDFNGDGKLDQTATGPEIEWTYGTAGDYQVFLKVEDNFGNLSLTDTIIASLLRDKPQVSIDFCPGGRVNEPITLIGRGRVTCGEIEKYFWNFGTSGQWDVTSHDQGRCQALYTRPGKYLARFMVMDTKRDTASAVIQLIINP